MRAWGTPIKAWAIVGLAARLPGERVFVIGMVESREWPAAAFDHVELTAPAARDDPCRALRSGAAGAAPPR